MASRRIARILLSRMTRVQSITTPVYFRPQSCLSLTRPSVPVIHRQYNTQSTMPFKVIDFNDIQQLIQSQNKCLIDVRETKEVAGGLIPTANNIPLSQFVGAWDLSEDDFKQQFGFEKPQKDDNITLYCLGGVRSTKAALYLSELGYEHLQNYVGSWADYVEKTKKQ
ncbi:Rhodanese-like domain-containing protein [Blakeslea trispora]|nr:Rhodanese-like domain-containing protein [Blakeslea trispora]